MAADRSGGKPAARTPAKAVTSKTATSSAKQRTIASFFQKSSPTVKSSPAAATPASVQQSPSQVSPSLPPSSSHLQETTKANSLPKVKPQKPVPAFNPKAKAGAKLLSTPVPSSDAIEPPSSQENMDDETPNRVPAATSLTGKVKSVKIEPAANGSSPSRKVSLGSLPPCDASSLVSTWTLTYWLLQARKAVNYAESSDDDDAFTFGESTKRRRAKRRAVVEDDEDNYEQPMDSIEQDEDGSCLS